MILLVILALSSIPVADPAPVSSLSICENIKAVVVRHGIDWARHHRWSKRVIAESVECVQR
jgi:hypothetical protein